MGIQSSVQSLAIAISPLILGVLMGVYREMSVIIVGLSRFVAAFVLGLSLQWVKAVKQQPDF